MRAFVLAVLALIATNGCAALGSKPVATPVAIGPAIRLTAPSSGAWTVRYDLPSPTQELVFERQPDNSRTRTWGVERGFELVATAEGERLRRRDGLAFRRVSVSVRPAYADLPKDYTPFSTFGDGGLLVYTGRFFACAESCRDGSRWAMRLDAPGRTILVDGRRHEGAARWLDHDNGRNVYLGATRPVESPEVLAVVDGTFPRPIRAQLEAQLPVFMRYFAERLGALEQRPMLFASYDPSHRPGWGSQAGTLPGQVFFHYYGQGWPAQMGKPDFANGETWLFAHEAAHLFQRGAAGDGADSWIHEGAAEAFAALVMRASGPDGRAYVERRLIKARAQCPKDLAGASLRDAAAGGDFDAAYSCGLLLSLALHDRLGGGDQNGLYALWRGYVMKGPGEPEARYLDLIAAAGGQALADAVRVAVRDPKPQFEAIAPS
jgi:hypothetical protein